jgi:hypothetical protein
LLLNSDNVYFASSLIAKPTKYTEGLLQGISFRNGLYELALRDKDMQLRLGLKMVLEC